MKYPKFLQMLTIAAVVTSAVPLANGQSVYASDEQETPGEYEARTEYSLPEGYHYILSEGKYVVFDENGQVIIEKNELEETAPKEEPPQEEPPQEEPPQEEPPQEEPPTNTVPQEPDGGDVEEIPEESGSGDVEEAPEGPGSGDVEETPEEPDGGDVEETPEEPGSGDVEEPPEEPGSGIGEEPGTEIVNRTPEAVEGQNREKTYELELPQKKKKYDLDFKASKPFIAIGDRICYNVEVPIEGLPSFITQEMIVGALKAQDETGYPASVTIAQIINESGYGKYGPGGEDGQGLSYLAYQYCNLFGIKGTGTAGSVVMNTKEMTPDGVTYSTQAGFRAYNTYTECIEDRSELLKNVYSDLTANVTDANTFAVNIGRRWATGIHYGQRLIKTMETYDLYRLDEMTLMDFSKMIGTFANPCPGSHITSCFGYRLFDDKFHKGLDMGTGLQNIPTYAAEAGTVTYAGSAGAAGNLIIIDHGDGLVTKYMHHSQIYVKQGQQVEKGQQIGLSGTTGRSTGNHLHFQVEKDGTAIDPMIYLTNDQ